MVGLLIHTSFIRDFSIRQLWYGWVGFREMFLEIKLFFLFFFLVFLLTKLFLRGPGGRGSMATWVGLRSELGRKGYLDDNVSLHRREEFLGV